MTNDFTEINKIKSVRVESENLNVLCDLLDVRCNLSKSSIGLGFFGSDAPPLFRLNSWDVTSQQECTKEFESIKNFI